MSIVLDTNVLVSALRSRQGASWQVLTLVRKGQVRMYVTVPLVLEYKDALLRHRHIPGWSRRETLGFVGVLVSKARHQTVYYRWRGHSDDPDDDHVLEAAVASGVPYLITFNVKDFSAAHRFGIEVRSPGEFLHMINE